MVRISVCSWPAESLRDAEEELAQQLIGIEQKVVFVRALRIRAGIREEQRFS